MRLYVIYVPLEKVPKYAPVSQWDVDWSDLPVEPIGPLASSSRVSQKRRFRHLPTRIKIPKLHQPSTGGCGSCLAGQGLHEALSRLTAHIGGMGCQKVAISRILAGLEGCFLPVLPAFWLVCRAIFDAFARILAVQHGVFAVFLTHFGWFARCFVVLFDAFWLACIVIPWCF